MNIYAKLQKARVMLQEINIKKSGKNKFAGFDYFELQDLMPHINKVMLECGLCGVVTFGDNTMAQLTINEFEGDRVINFYTPTADATIKGSTPIQCLGSMHTYIRRYLWLLALEIVEHDAIDAANQSKPEPKKQVNQDYENMMRSAASLQHLQAIWQTIPKTERANFEYVKEEMKKILIQNEIEN